jgi:hypothetical protein
VENDFKREKNIFFGPEMPTAAEFSQSLKKSDSRRPRFKWTFGYVNNTP